MREILFRGKRKDNGEWVEGDLIRHYENQRRFIACDQLAYKYTECGIDRLVTERFHEVIPETVGQFTGLLDKNGKKIFEGDIVRNGNDLHKYVVEYVDEYWYAFLFTDIETGECFHLYEFDVLEAVGNIHDKEEA